MRDTNVARLGEPPWADLVATATIAAIGNGAALHKGQDFAAGVGIVPDYSTGGKEKLLGISKRGNVYLRKILIHGARAAVLRIKRDRAPIGPWLDALDTRTPKNVVVVAMANIDANCFPYPQCSLAFMRRILHSVYKSSPLGCKTVCGQVVFAN